MILVAPPKGTLPRPKDKNQTSINRHKLKRLQGKADSAEHHKVIYKPNRTLTTPADVASLLTYVFWPRPSAQFEADQLRKRMPQPPPETLVIKEDISSLVSPWARPPKTILPPPPYPPPFVTPCPAPPRSQSMMVRRSTAGGSRPLSSSIMTSEAFCVHKQLSMNRYPHLAAHITYVIPPLPSSLSVASSSDASKNSYPPLRFTTMRQMYLNGSLSRPPYLDAILLSRSSELTVSTRDQG